MEKLTYSVWEQRYREHSDGAPSGYWEPFQRLERLRAVYDPDPVGRLRKLYLPPESKERDLVEAVGGR